MFLVLTFSGAYPLVGVWGLAYHGMLPGGSAHRWLHIDPGEVAGLALAPPLFLAALYVTWAADGHAGVTRLLRRMTRWRVGVGWWLTVLLGLPALGTGFALLLGDTFITPTDPVHLVVAQLGSVAVNLIVIDLWEGTAWTGLFQPRLEQRCRRHDRAGCFPRRD